MELTVTSMKTAVLTQPAGRFLKPVFTVHFLQPPWRRAEVEYIVMKMRNNYTNPFDHVGLSQKIHYLKYGSILNKRSTPSTSHVSAISLTLK